MTDPTEITPSICRFPALVSSPAVARAAKNWTPSRYALEIVVAFRRDWRKAQAAEPLERPAAQDVHHALGDAGAVDLEEVAEAADDKTERGDGDGDDVGDVGMAVDEVVDGQLEEAFRKERGQRQQDEEHAGD